MIQFCLQLYVHISTVYCWETKMDDKFECRGKWFLLIIRTPLRLVKFCFKAYLRCVLKVSTIVAVSRIRPPTITSQAHAGVCEVDSAGADGGAASVWKVKVDDQSLGAGSSAMTFQK
jgi:hypothetical protein